MSIKLVVFDMAGTTVKDDNGVAKAFQAALQQYGYSIPLDEINPIMGYEKTEAIRMMLGRTLTPEQITAEHVCNIHRTFVQHMLDYYHTTPDIMALPHAEATLQALRQQGVKVGINTGFSRNIAMAIVDKLGWEKKGIFDYLVASDEVPQGRPHPYMVQRMMEAAGITDPKETAKVGDTAVDIREGQNVGSRYIIGVTTGAFTRAALEPYQPTHIIDDIAEVLDIVRG
ncbi:phosphonoacetaldehyde hydrolase [Chitinophaga parva]|uniref:Phosphonoacetaldehyde hydrolase n=1 Tax=Chitinophaga parva TaxID=2169414 RepID=A0A2T7BLY5_9BACT|nr:HAD-IA family hydrolase [Chitinophaga parva]PUZ28695.1 phosphonoacetaldehyde hydrolase [Chitinophaga parva]